MPIAKPSPWNVTPAYVAPEWVRFRRRLLFELPIWDMASLPRELISGTYPTAGGTYLTTTSRVGSAIGPAIDWHAGDNGSSLAWALTGTQIGETIGKEFEALVYLRAGAPARDMLLFALDGHATVTLVWDAVNSWHELNATVPTSAVFRSAQMTTAFPTGRWVHVFVVLQAAGTPIIWLDGVLTAAGAAGSGTNVAYTGTTRLSATADVTALDECSIGLVRLYRDLSATTVPGLDHTARQLARDPFGSLRYDRRQRYKVAAAAPGLGLSAGVLKKLKARRRAA